MRSRYTAYVVGEPDHVFRTWHPRTRPAEVAPSAGLVWQRLEVVATEAGGVGDDEGVVEFRATYQAAGRTGVLHEVSRFTRRGGRWVYVGEQALHEGRLGARSGARTMTAADEGGVKGR